jgi:hypothetical protein
MGEPLVRFPAVCPDCGREHLASIPVGVFAAALIANDRISLEADRHNSFSQDAPQAASNHLHEYLAAIVRCPADQRRVSTTLKAGKDFARIAPPRTSARSFLPQGQTSDSRLDDLGRGGARSAE